MPAHSRLGFRDRAPDTQHAAAESLNVHRSSVSRALCNTGMEQVAMQARILSLLEGAPVQRRSTYQGTEVQHEWIISPWTCL